MKLMTKSVLMLMMTSLLIFTAGCQADPLVSIVGSSGVDVDIIQDNDQTGVSGQDNVNIKEGCDTCGDGGEVKDCSNWECNGKPLSFQSCQELTIPVLVEREDCEWLGTN